MSIYLIFGAPGSGKSTLAKSLFDDGAVDKIFCTDVFSNLEWSEGSAAVAGALFVADSTPSIRWVFEGYSLARGVRKLYKSGNTLKTVSNLTVLGKACDRWEERKHKEVTSVLESLVAHIHLCKQ